MPGGCWCDGLFEVLGETSVAAEPCEGSFHHPAARQHLEAFGGVGPLDDFDGPFALSDLAQCLPELVTGIPTIGEDVPPPREAADYFGEDERSPVAILDRSTKRRVAKECAR